MDNQKMTAQMIAAIERNTAVLERLAALLESGVAVAGSAQDTAVMGRFPAIDLSASMLDGKIYWKIKGGKFSRHGLTLWPEMAVAHGFDLDSLNIQQKYPLTGWPVVYTEGDPPRIADLIPPETAVSQPQAQPRASHPTPPGPVQQPATTANGRVAGSGETAVYQPGDRVKVQGNNGVKLATINYFSSENGMVSVQVDGQPFTISADRIVARA